MSRLEAATRIVSIADELQTRGPSAETRNLLMSEQSELWDEYFEGRPFEAIAADAWMHKVVFRYPLKV